MTKRVLSGLACAWVVAMIAAIAMPQAAYAYSYAAAGKEPLIENRQPLLTAMKDGDWKAADTAYQGMKADLDYLDKNEDPGIGKIFADAIAAKNAEAVRQALLRAYADEVQRRLAGARDNIKDYQAAKILVVKAQRFYAAMAGDLPPARSKAAQAGLEAALAAIGNPGVFGVGRTPADPKAFDEAHAKVHAALADAGRPGGGKP